MWLLIAFIAVPLIEIGLFIQVGGWLGTPTTLLIVLVTAVLGTYLVKSQGMAALGQLQTSFSDLRDPTEPLVHGAMILFAGALLLTPGFFTDAFGFALLVPQLRKLAYQAIRARVKVASFGTPGGESQRHDPRRDPRQGDVIEGDYTEIPSENSPPKGPSGWTKD